MKFITLLLGSILVLASWSRASAQANELARPDPVILSDGQGEYPLGRHLEILEDPGGQLTIDDVSSPRFEARFLPSQAAVPNYGFTDSVYWVRLGLDNQTRQTGEWLLEQGFANTQYLDLYTPLPDGEGFSVKQTGTLRPPSTRDIPYPRIVFNLTIPPESQKTLYLRFQNEAAMTLALTLWAQEAFQIKSQREQALQGLFYGALIGLLVYNLFFLFTSIRDSSYLYLASFLASFIFFMASYDGYIVTYFLTDLYSLGGYFIALSFAAFLISVLLFANHFLKIKTLIPQLYQVNIVLLGVWGLLVFLTPFVNYHILTLLMVPWALLSLAMVLVAGIISFLRGFYAARYFLVAWSGLLVTLSLVMLVRFGLLPSTVFNESAFRLGAVWMGVCWSIALVDRINLLKAETEAANLQCQKSERRISEILEGLPLGVVVYGKDQKPNYINRRAVEILGDPERGILPDISAGRSLAQAIQYFSLKVSGSDETYPLDKFPVFGALHGEAAMVEDIEADQGVKRIPLEIMASPIKDDSGNVESAVVAFQDISLRKQAERALHTSEKRFRVIAENNFDGIAFMGRDRKVLYVSPSYLRLVGKTAEELIGQSGVGLVHPDDRDYTAEKFDEVLQKPSARVSAVYRIPHQDGSWIWVETFATNMLDDPDVQAVVLNSHNITERKQTEAELADYRLHLESLVESRTAELSAANEQLQRHLKWLSAVNLINQIMAISADFTQIYQKVIEIINNLFDTHGSFIVELDDASKQLRTLAHSCPGNSNQDLIGTLAQFPEAILSGSNLAGGSPIYLSKDQLGTISGPMGAHLQDPDIQNIALMPLVLREKVYGYLGLEMEERRLYTSEAADLLRIFSTDIAQLIENQRVYEQSKATIAAEERNRLARDLHDSVTQVLFSAALLADVLPQIWRRDPELGIQRLEKLRLLTRGALAEMRTMLLELRPTAMIKTPLGDLLAQLTEAIASRSGIPFKLFIERIPPLPEEVQTAFYRIAQEALNNVVKHAQAKQVTVSLSAVSLAPDSTGGAGYAVNMVIQDDGVGYPPGREKSGHLGMSIMRERAAAIQANLSLESQPGYGTKVTLNWVNGIVKSSALEARSST